MTKQEQAKIIKLLNASEEKGHRAIQSMLRQGIPAHNLTAALNTIAAARRYVGMVGTE